METTDDTAEYYRMRESQERSMALKARNEEVRSIHLALADKYRERADLAEEKHTKA